MPSKRPQRRVKRLLVEAEEAADRGEWLTVAQLAQEAFALDDTNQDARALLTAAEGMQAAKATQEARESEANKSASKFATNQSKLERLVTEANKLLGAADAGDVQGVDKLRVRLSEVEAATESVRGSQAGLQRAPTSKWRDHYERELKAKRKILAEKLDALELSVNVRTSVRIAERCERSSPPALQPVPASSLCHVHVSKPVPRRLSAMAPPHRRPPCFIDVARGS